MTRVHRFVLPFVFLALSLGAAPAKVSPANRLTYLDELNPFYVDATFPKLTTPQWVGESEVEAVVILAIDDMRDLEKWEAYLRPLLTRLKQIDGRAPVSIMTVALDPQLPRLQTWLQEGVSLEVHTLTHPCPLLANSNFVAASDTYHGCVELMNKIPGNHPVAFRMPCCDSMNSPSPRFYAELFNATNRAGQFLTLDSSVMNLLTPKDNSLPRELVVDADGRERFRKYLPAQTNATTRVSMGSFTTTIEDYPYPYVVGRLCWEFPAMVPSDWEAQNLQGVNHPNTIADWKAALDAAVIKQGTFTFIFHPHGWIRPEQMVEFIDYAVQRYGKKVKFLNFREAQERINKNLLAGEPLRAPSNGQDNGVRLLDLNNDGYLDVVIANERVRKTRVWNATTREWTETSFPTAMAGLQFGVVRSDGHTTAIKVGRAGRVPYLGAWHFDGNSWIEDQSLLNGLTLDGQPILTIAEGHDRGVRFRDLDNDGRCELIVANETQQAVFSWTDSERVWKRLPGAWPKGAAIVNGAGEDNGLRFADLNDDGFDDVIFSNESNYSVHLFIATPKPHLGWERGWTFKMRSGKRGDPNEIPMIVRGGTHRNNGAWFHSRHLWVQNEDVAHLPDKVDRRSFKELLVGDESPPKSPEQSLAAMKVRPGFKVELVASEPLVIDPVAFDWGADGKLWVVEMRDYPSGNGGRGGVVKYLEDTDGDGRYDKATVFLEGLNFPNGIMPWRRGVLISAAPDIIYAEDSDGDGKADVRKVLFSGFGEGNQQHRVNGFEYGLDNWVYAANGESGGTIRSVATGQSISIRGHDLRFRPDTGVFETVEGQTQFGRRRDDLGNWFGNNNPTWLWHFFLPEHYLARNPHLAVNTTRKILANYAEANSVYSIGRPQQRFNWPDAIRQTTSACSPTPYRDDLFGPEFASSVFISEPANNVIHREVLETNGVSFVSHRAPDELKSEFLASTDNWFRPTMLKTGPDGALYVADMYRLVIEHPEYFPEELKQRPDLRAGEDKGRIYRVYPEGATLRHIPRLDRLNATNLVAALENPNGWQRDTAQRLLVQSGDKSQSILNALVALGANSSNARTRIHVLATCEGLGVLTAKLAYFALGDRQAPVREFGVRLTEPFLKTTSPAGVNRQITEALVGLADDPSLRVRYQLALTLGEWNDPRAARALAKIALKDQDNAEVLTAVMSSATNHVSELLSALVASSVQNPPPAGLVEQLVGLAVALNDERAMAITLEHAAQPAGDTFAAWQFGAVAGFLDALDRRKLSLKMFYASAPPERQRTLARLEGIFVQARQITNLPIPGRAAQSDLVLAIRLLGRGLEGQDQDIRALGKMLLPQVSADIQQAALAALKRANSPLVAEVFLAGWKLYSPNLRTEILNVLLSRPGWLRQLLAAIEAGNMSTAEIGPVHQQKLTAHADLSLRERASKLFSASTADRRSILSQYASAKDLIGNPEKGAALFRQNCVACHRFKEEGNNIGPDLGTVADKSMASLLVAILDPNQAVESRFINYTAVTKSDREISGIITAETPNSITLRTAGGGEEMVLRNDLTELTGSGLSMMPEGFEQALKPQDLADLISYILSR